MKYPALLLILLCVQSARSQYVYHKKGDFWNGYSAETVCRNPGGDTLTMVLKAEKTSIPLDSVAHMTYRDRKSWWPYLLTAGLVGASTYTVFHFTSKDDAWYTGEGKARFGGIFWGGITLALGAVMKEAVETRILIHPTLNIHDAGVLVQCEF